MNPKYSSLKQSHRSRELDGLRGVAILLVLIGHFSATYPVYFPSGPTPPFSIYFGGMGVQLFFMISGYVILISALRQGSAVRYLINRAVRLYPAYWVALAISSLIIATVGIEYKTITAPQVLINATMFHRFLFVDNVDDVYWTLAIEWQFYLLLFVLLLWKKNILPIAQC
ncbi:acyltransferase family protein [Rothia terrae]|uniref:acyltransferase family protein n=1 Tax=Rothia terrae TaxID=396015 RepID=UPI002881A85B|nr:acyltransferase [Rothia terrae]MDT0190169.1 acyltransferase [Rothia terrae]